MTIVKRKKGKSEYYYARHSFRKDGKVITKERYLGKEIPKNNEKIQEELKKEDLKELIKKLEKIKSNWQKEWKKYPKSIKEKQKEQISISFTYNTNAIEGSTITLDETREIIHDKIAPNKPLRDIKETEFHSKVFLSMLNKKELITQEKLLEWHKDIFYETKQDIAGKFRDYFVKVGEYLAPDWQDIEDLIKSLIQFVKTSKENPVILAGKVHYKFEKIHPFGDGNGRIGRLLMNYILWHNKYPMIIIEYKKRKSYYRALQKSEDEFVKYFIRRYLSIHKKRII